MRGTDVTDKQIAHAKAFCRQAGMVQIEDHEAGMISARVLYRVMAWYRAVGIEAERKRRPVENGQSTEAT